MPVDPNDQLRMKKDISRRVIIKLDWEPGAAFEDSVYRDVGAMHFALSSSQSGVQEEANAS
jgi:hypothetical protein